MNAFFLGTILGLTITISFGPGFMALFQTSLIRGLAAGIVFAIGMLLGDLMMVAVCYLGLSEIILSWDTRIMGVAAGSILIVMGAVSVFRKSEPSWDLQTTSGIRSDSGFLLIKGFLINIINPFSLVFWLGIVGFAAKNWHLHSQNFMLFFAGVFITAFSTDLLKCYLSGMLRKILVAKTIHRINKYMGFVFIAIGLFLIYKVQK